MERVLHVEEAAGYGLLPEAERGHIVFFRKAADSQGNAILVEVDDRLDYEQLPTAEQGPIRYFRKLVGEGAQYPFDAGETL